MSCFQQVLLTSKDNCQWNSTLVILIRPVSVCSGKYQHWDLTVLFFFSSSRYKFQGQHVYAVSILSNAFQHHQNTLKRKMRCICWWALVVLLRQGNFRKSSRDWSTHVATSVIKQPTSSLRCSCTSCSKIPLWVSYSFFSFGYSLWIVLKSLLMNSGVLNANHKSHLLYFVHFAQQTPFHSTQKNLQGQLGIRKKLN